MNAPLSADQERSLLEMLNTPHAGPAKWPNEIINGIRAWAAEQNDPDVVEWFEQEYPNEPAIPEPDPTVATASTTASTLQPAANSSGHQLANHLNSLGSRDLSFGQASNLGVELVHHPNSDHNQVFHTAGGDVVYLRADSKEWDVVEQGRNGVAVKSGDMERVHTAYISDRAEIADTAIIADTATVEPGARIGPHATVGEHAHIGADTTLSSYTRVEDGAFIGAFSSVRDGSRIGPGAVVGSGSRIGSTTNVGAGARLEQRTEIAAFDNVTANSRVGGSSTNQSSNGSRVHPAQITNVIDRLAALDRD